MSAVVASAVTVQGIALGVAIAGTIVAVAVVVLVWLPSDLRAVSRRARALGVVLCDYVDDVTLLSIASAYGIHVSATDIEEETGRTRKLSLGIGDATLGRDSSRRSLRRYTLGADRNMLLDAALCRLEEEKAIVAIDELLRTDAADQPTTVERLEANVPLLLVSGRWRAHVEDDSVVLDLDAIQDSRGRDIAFAPPPFAISCELEAAGITQRGRIRFRTPSSPLLVVVGTPTSGESAGALALIPLGVFQRTHSGVPALERSLARPPLGIDVMDAPRQ